MRYDNTNSSALELAALQWFEQMRTPNADEATFEAHRRWLKIPANTDAYTKIEQIFTLIHTLADHPAITLLSEQTNKRLERRYPPARIQNPNENVKTSLGKSK